MQPASEASAESRQGQFRIGENGAPIAGEGLPWLLPEIVGDIKVAANSGVIQFQVGVPVECVFDEVETRVAGALVEPMQLKPGLHNVYLHFFDLFNNSIVLGELRLSGAGREHVIPFRLIVSGNEGPDFEYVQAFSDHERQAWGIETGIAGESVWLNLCQNFLAGLPEFERRINQRPCKRSDLEAVEKEFDRSLVLLRNTKERLRTRNSFLSDPANWGGAIHRVRTALRRSYAHHKKASALVGHCRELVAKGHVNRAESEAAALGPKVSEFSDLDFGFIVEAKRHLGRARRRLIYVGAALLIAFLYAAVIIKLLNRQTPSMP